MKKDLEVDYCPLCWNIIDKGNIMKIQMIVVSQQIKNKFKVILNKTHFTSKININKYFNFLC